jgi:hypothetical protein
MYDLSLLPPRVLDRIVFDGYSGCWRWCGYRNEKGYGRAEVKGLPPTVHQITYTLLVGPVPEGLVLDHLCRVRDCSCPRHLEPVTAEENFRRGATGWNGDKTHCPAGHPYDEVNTYWIENSKGSRRRDCRACRHPKSEVCGECGTKRRGEHLVAGRRRACGECLAWLRDRNRFRGC